MSTLHAVGGAILASRRRALYKIETKTCEIQLTHPHRDCGQPAVGLLESWDFTRKIVCDDHATAARGMGGRILTWQDVAPLPHELRHRWSRPYVDDGHRECRRCGVTKPEKTGGAGPCEPWAHGIA